MSFSQYTVRFFGFFLFLAFSLTACSAPYAESESQFLLGTVCTIKLFNKKDSKLYPKAFEKIIQLEGILSANEESSDIARINSNQDLSPIRVRAELIEVLGKALEYAEKSGGAFDPSIGPLVKLWGIGTESEHLPGGEEIRQALELINYRDIQINYSEETVLLKKPLMSLDLGAIAKGYIADEVALFLKENGVQQAIIDLGGDIFALGEKEGKKGSSETYWRIGIQDPRKARGSYIGILNVKNKSVVTSGDYERFFEEGGKRYHHIFSVESGFPAETGLKSVTIAADKAIDADALSTAAFVLGWEKGRRLVDSVPGAQGLFVFDDLTISLTGGLEKDFTLTAPEYNQAK